MARQSTLQRKRAALDVDVLALAPAMLSRAEVFALAARYAEVIGEVSHGKGADLDAPPFEREIQHAAGTVGADLRNLLRVLAEHPRAETFRLVGGSVHGEAWLAIAALYAHLDVDEADRITAPLAAVLREHSAARKAAA